MHPQAAQEALERKIRELEETSKATAEALRQSREAFQSLFDDHMAVKLIIDPDTGAIIHANRAAAVFYGWPRETLAKMNIRQINTMPPGQVKGAMQEAREQKRIHFEFRHKLADGSVRDVEVFSSKIRLEGYEYLHSIIHNITEQKRTQQEDAILAEIGRIIGSSLNIDEIYERFADEARKLISFDRLTVNLSDPHNDGIRLAYTNGMKIVNRKPGDTIPLAGSLTQTLFQTRTGFIVNTERLEEFIKHYPAAVDGYQAGLRSLMSVPLISRGEIIGGLGFRSQTRNAYSERDLSLGQRIADQIAGAIANAQSHVALKTAEQEIATIAEIGRIISSSLHIDEVYERFTIEVKKLIGFDSIGISLNDVPAGLCRISYVSPPGMISRRQGDVFPLTGSLNERVMQTRDGLIVHLQSLDDVAKQCPEIAERYKAGLRSAMIVPLFSQSEVIGSLNFRSMTPNAFTAQDLILAQRIGDHIVGAIVNAQSHADLKRAEQEIAVIAEIGRIIGSSLNMEEIYEQFTREANKLIQFDRLAVSIIKNGLVKIAHVFKTDIPGRPSGVVFPLAGSFNEEVLKVRKGLMVCMERLEDTANYPSLVDGYRAGERSLLSVPLFSHGEVIGVLSFRSKTLNAYTEGDLALAQRIADQIAGAIANATLYKGLSETEKAVRRNYDALQKSEAKFRAIVENSHDGILFLDSAGQVLFQSPSYRQINGYNGEEWVGRSLFEAIHPDDLTAIRRNWEEVLEQPDALQELTYRLQHKDQTWKTVESTVQNLLNNPDIQAIFMTTQDVTEHRRVEEQLLQAQKMEAVGRLAGGVAHDSNNMLGVILGHAEMALEQADPTRAFHPSLQEIKKAAERSANLARQLLAFARKQTIAPRVLDVNETVAGMLKMLQRIIGEDIDLTWQPGMDLWPVKMDSSQIDQILANLCVNARDAIAGVGKITIETANTVFDEEYCALHPGFLPGDYVRLAVSDDGCGMDRETMAHLFEPFFTTKKIGKGTGLGLATVYGIVRQNNGFINVYSEPRQGTTFSIYLPRYAGKAEQERPEETPEPAERGQETILVVEDEPALLELTATLLRGQGYRVIAAGTPGEAIRLASEHHGKLHLLMTDVVMPEMNGRELAKNLLSLYPDLKRLFTSGYTANVIAHHGVLDEGVHFIQKPFSIKKLAAKIREVLDETGEN